MKVLGKKIIFTWVDETEDKEFIKNGLIFTRKLDAKRSRWGKVVAIGPEVSEVLVGEYILPEEAQEPFGAVVKENGVKTEYWACWEKDVALVTDDVTETYQVNGEFGLQELVRKAS